MVLTLLRLYQVVLQANLSVQDVLDLCINLLGFRLLNKNITVMGLEQGKRNLANA